MSGIGFTGMISVKSRKAKGRRLQDWVRKQLIKQFGFKATSVRTAVMGERGIDVQLQPNSLKRFPYAIECKNQERYRGLYQAWDQTLYNTKKGMEPLLVIKANSRQPLIVVDAEHFFKLRAKLNDT